MNINCVPETAGMYTPVLLQLLIKYFLNNIFTLNLFFERYKNNESFKKSYNITLYALLHKWYNLTY